MIGLPVLITQAAIEVGLIGIAISVGSALVSKLISNPKKMADIKKQMSDLQKRMAEARKSGDQAAISKLEVEQKQMMPLMKKLMINSLKPMAVTFVPIVLVLSFLGSNYGKIPANQFINLPLLGYQGWLIWYIIVAVISGLLFELAYKQYSSRKEKVKQQ